MSKPSEDVGAIEQLLATAQYAKAVEMCEALQLQEDLPRKFWFRKAKALEGLGETRRAIQCYRCEIATLKRVPPFLLGYVGSLLLKVGQYHDAAACLRKSCELEPSAGLFVFLSSALLHLGRDDESRAALRHALDVDPSHDEAWHNLGGRLLRECPEEAEAAFRRALELDPDRADSYGGLGQACLDQGRTEEGLQAAEEGLRRNSLSGLCHFVVGQGLETMGCLDAAQAAFAKAFRCDDYDKVAALLALAGILERQGQPEAAIAWYERGIRAWPDDDRIESELAALKERRGDD